MKKLFALATLLAMVGLAAFADVPMVPTPITIAWNYPETNIDNTFVLHVSSVAAAPLPWPGITNIAGTNLSVTISPIPSRMFYYVTASNFWGDGPPSIVMGTPSAPTNVLGTTIRKP
jgi:hypothetical protein